MIDIHWTTEKRVVSDLIEFEHNPRKLSEESKQRLIRSLKRFNLAEIPAINHDNTIIAGHQRIKCLILLGRSNELIDVRVPSRQLSIEELKEYNIISNVNVGEWDLEILDEEFEDINLEDLGLKVDEMNEIESTIKEIDEAEHSEISMLNHKISVIGDLYELNNHIVICGDCRDSDLINKGIGKKRIQIVHSDPPYGMGKQKDGVLNDNIYKENLDEFQMEWISTLLPFCDQNCSLYIWGNPPDLWRLWYNGGLNESNEFTYRNQIVWDKKNIAGMKSGLMTQYPIVSESCLFLNRGNQYKGNLSKLDHFEGYNIVLDYLKQEAKNAGLTSKTLNDICGTNMWSHWFTESQFSFLPKNQYEKIQHRFPDYFKRSYDDLKSDYTEAHKAFKNIKENKRSFFDNTHEVMTDVWHFDRVRGEERYGHATPKPVEMINRIMRSSSREGDIVFEPFLGSGSTLISAEQTKRICIGTELAPEYCDVTVKRWILYMKDNKKEWKIKRNGHFLSDEQINEFINS